MGALFGCLACFAIGIVVGWIACRIRQHVKTPPVPRTVPNGSGGVRQNGGEQYAKASTRQGAAAILASTQKARALAPAGQGAPRGVSFHVKRQEDRGLTVVRRLQAEPATDRVVAHFPADAESDAWHERNRRQYGLGDKRTRTATD